MEALGTILLVMIVSYGIFFGLLDSQIAEA